MKRRAFLSFGAALPLASLADSVRYPAVTVGYRLEFPRDHGAHPEFRQEWWYVTGWLETASRDPLGFQVTFFRARPDTVSDNPSAFTPRQVILAQAALSDPRHGRLRHEERAARAALGLAGAEEGDAGAWVDDWRLERSGAVWRARVRAREFSLDLEFAPTRLPVAHGLQGFSRKGHRPEEASYYYSFTALRVRGAVERDGARQEAGGVAWLDHEWSSQYLPAEADGWDWTGINFHGGGALMLFRMRDAKGAPLYAGGTLLAKDDRARPLLPTQVGFTPLRRWRSPRSGAEYPVAVRVAALDSEWTLEPLMDDQEMDARLSAGTIYWEGAVRALAGGAEAGRGYLELTGYWRPMKL